MSFNHPFDDNPLHDAPKAKKKRERRVREEQSATKHGVKLRFTLFAIFAAVAGILVMFTVTGNGSTVYVARVKVPIAAGMAVDISDNRAIEIVSLPKSAIEPGTFSDSRLETVQDRLRKELTDQRSIYSLSVGQQLRPEFFTGVGSGVPQRDLAADERQISITAKASRAVAGTIRPGDRVDVYAVTNSGVSGVLGKNIEVVAVSLPPDSLENAASAQGDSQGRTLAQIVPQNAIGGTYVLRVKAGDAAYFFAADIGGSIYLALRSADSVDVAVDPTNALLAVCRQSPSPACRER